jgi:hypothetical protein
MLKLLTITLSRSSTLLSGDNYNILPEVLERLLPLLARPELAGLHPEVAGIVCRILTLLHASSSTPGLLASLARGALALFEGVCVGGGRVDRTCCCWLSQPVRCCKVVCGVPFWDRPPTRLCLPGLPACLPGHPPLCRCV